MSQMYIWKPTRQFRNGKLNVRWPCSGAARHPRTRAGARDGEMANSKDEGAEVAALHKPGSCSEEGPRLFAAGTLASPLFQRTTRSPKPLQQPIQRV